MGKAVVYALVLTAFIVFIIFSPKNQRHHAKFSLNRRLGFKTPLPNFDPLVTKMKRSAENRNSTHDNEYVNTETKHKDEKGVNEYFDPSGRLNVTLRILILFPVVDSDPKDGLISYKELNAWHTVQAREKLNYQTQKKLEIVDRDSDGEVTLREYLPHFNNEYFERNGTGHGEAGWYREQFANADHDGNGKLNLDEFMDFLHPEESNSTAIQKWLLKEKIKSMDYNDNNKLDYSEFVGHVYDIYKSYFQYENPGIDVPKPEQKFAELDVNKSHLLEIEELLPIFSYLLPGQLSYARYYTTYLINQADDNKDGQLSLGEMINHENTFYETLFEEEEDDDFDYDYHDEL